MTSVRPYRPSLTVEQAMRELEEGKQVQFDAEMVDAPRAFKEHVALLIPRLSPAPAAPHPRHGSTSRLI
jgi:HD-GYP domain-containing protein (c-di-GMP phosphodiesterase class II)